MNKLKQFKSDLRDCFLFLPPLCKLEHSSPAPMW